MPEQLYALTARTADSLRGLIADGGSVGGRASSGAAARGSTWVKVTSGTAVSGWYPGVVSVDVGGTFGDLTAAVKVSAADGSALTNGKRYLCTRTGDDADGARFRTETGSTGASPLTTKGDLYTRSSSADARLAVGTNGQVLTADSAQTLGVKWATPATAGDVLGPSSATDNAVARFDGGTGKRIQNSGVIIDDNNNVLVPGLLTIDGDVGDSPGGGTITLKIGGVAVGSIYCLGSTFYFVAGDGSGLLTDAYFAILNATGGVRIGSGQTYNVGASVGQSVSFTVKQSGVDKTATYVGGILVNVS